MSMSKKSPLLSESKKLSALRLALQQERQVAPLKTLAQLEEAIQERKPHAPSQSKK